MDNGCFSADWIIKLHIFNLSIWKKCKKFYNRDFIEFTKILEIKIKDNGIGLDPIYAEKIFNAFERLHFKDEFEGNGLGLALCRKIAKRHNDTIASNG